MTRIPLQRVVVASDLSPGARAALRRAAWLPLAPGATLSLVHALPDGLRADLRPAAAERAMTALRAAAAEAAAVARGRGLEVKLDCAVVAGAAHVELVRFARAADADLLVVGRHGARPLRDALLGSTAERVIRKGDTPLLLVNGDAADAYQRALVALDLSEVSGRVADLALSLLPPEARALRLVHAFHLPFEEWLGGAALDELRAERRRAVAAAAEVLAASYPERGVRCDVAIREGDPRLVLLHEVERARPDLVVVGTHARAGVAHALLGSVAEWLVRSCPCDVAVTRPARFTFELP